MNLLNIYVTLFSISFAVIVNENAVTAKTNLLVDKSKLMIDQQMVGNNNKQMESVTPLEIAAISRVASIGELYDARTDQFLPISIFNQKLERNHIISTQNKETKLIYSFANSLQEKFSLMEVSAEVSLRVLFVKFTGSGRFFQDTKKSWRSAKVSMINSFSTVYETVSLTASDMRNNVNSKAVEKIDATHVVVGIQWGGHIFVSVEDENAQNEDQRTVEGRLGAAVKGLGMALSASAGMKIDEKFRSLYERFNFKLYGDIVPESPPQNLVDAVKFMKEAPKKLLEGNNGKGKAVKYVMLPLKFVLGLFSVNKGVEKLVNSIGEETIKRCVALHDDMNIVEQKLNDLHSDMIKMDPYIETKVINEIKELKNNYNYYQALVKKDLSETLTQVRSGQKPVTALQDVIIKAMKDPYSWQNTELKLSNFDFIVQEMTFLKMIQSQNIKLLSKYSDLQLILWENFNRDIFILFYNYDKAEESNFNATNTFRRMYDYKNFSNAVFAAVNNEVLYKKKNTLFLSLVGQEPKISYFRNGKLLVADFDFEMRKQNHFRDPQLWPLAYMQMQVADLIKAGRFPINYIYTQLPFQKDPNEMWPDTVWEDVTIGYMALIMKEPNKMTVLGESNLTEMDEMPKQRIYGLRFWKRTE